MVYLQAGRTFMYHVDLYSSTGRRRTKYFTIVEGELLTLCQAIQTFDMTLTDIFHRYPLNVVRIIRTQTYRDSAGKRFAKSFDNVTYLG